MADAALPPLDGPLVQPDLEGERMERRRSTAAARPLRLRMAGRDPNEPHRSATPLELFFDLVFVVAVAQVALALHHAISDGHPLEGLTGYLVVFLVIWWPWVNFTWFASAFDTDDVPYRLLTFLQMTGVLIVAAGVPRVLESFDFTIAVVGYVLMRIALVGQWIRVAREDPRHRATARRFALGIALVQVGWILRLAIPGPVGIALFIVLMAIELLIPAWAERAGEQTPWHPEHIIERYGLFTIIVLGECVLAATMAVQAALEAEGVTMPLLAVAVGGLLILFSLWWSYFKLPTLISHHLRLRWQLAWSYGHYVLFAAVAALGAGLQVVVEGVRDPEHVPPVIAALSVSLPAAVYLLAIGLLHHPGAVASQARAILPPAVGLIVVAALAPMIGVPVAVLSMGCLLVVVVAWHVRRVHLDAVLAA